MCSVAFFISVNFSDYKFIDLFSGLLYSELSSACSCRGVVRFTAVGLCCSGSNTAFYKIAKCMAAVEVSLL